MKAILNASLKREETAELKGRLAVLGAALGRLEAEIQGVRLQGQPGLHLETLSSTTTTKIP